ncbi:hypothetical protein DY023_12275 [Microbacterium bovistercoris]|uniref:Uncharacterized protein n=1 Tax=Microbacterium bovistercoris TaxID=2293570 RepID=A0A371NS77_9MICO|nr:hypothetical protein [Microbacterium bovistercoris]REJ05014.1 hypothetical protein DY023_12275 [Microbacterium bovistercoris]
MRTTYKVLAYTILVLVAVQAAMHAWASAGLVAFLAGGGTIDFTSDAPPAVPEFLGIIVHGMNGMYVIPIVAIVLLIISFFAKIPGGTRRAAIVLGLVALQVTLGILAHSLSSLALLHGANAILLASFAFFAGWRVSHPAKAPAAQQPAMV